MHNLVITLAPLPPLVQCVRYLVLLLFLFIQLCLWFAFHFLICLIVEMYWPVLEIVVLWYSLRINQVQWTFYSFIIRNHLFGCCWIFAHNIFQVHFIYNEWRTIFQLLIIYSFNLNIKLYSIAYNFLSLNWWDYEISSQWLNTTNYDTQTQSHNNWQLNRREYCGGAEVSVMMILLIIGWNFQNAKVNYVNWLEATIEFDCVLSWLAIQLTCSQANTLNRQL